MQWALFRDRQYSRSYLKVLFIHEAVLRKLHLKDKVEVPTQFIVSGVTHPLPFQTTNCLYNTHKGRKRTHIMRPTSWLEKQLEARKQLGLQHRQKKEGESTTINNSWQLKRELGGVSMHTSRKGD